MIEEVTVIRVAANGTNCSTFEDEELVKDSCNVASHAKFANAFSSCVGQTSCSVSLDFMASKSEFPTVIPCVAPSDSNAVYFAAICAGKEIDFPRLKTKISRTTLTYLVVGCDMAIVLLFVINAGCLNASINKAEQELDMEGVQLTDFSVRIRNLPTQSDFGSLSALRVELTKHIVDIVRSEPQVFPELDAKYAHSGVPQDFDHSQIVNISFGLENFSQY